MLHWLPIEKIIIKANLGSTYKTEHGKKPRYLEKILERISNLYEYNIRFNIPSVSVTKIVIFRRRWSF